MNKEQLDRLPEYGSETEDILVGEISIERLYKRELERQQRNQMSLLLDELSCQKLIDFSSSFGSDVTDLKVDDFSVFVKKIIYTAYQWLLIRNDIEATHRLLVGLQRVIDSRPSGISKEMAKFEMNRAHAMVFAKKFAFVESIKHLNLAISDCPKVDDFFPNGLSDALVLLTECYSALGRRDDALHSSRLAVNIAHERMEAFRKQRIVSEFYGQMLSIEALVLDCSFSLVLTYCTLGCELEKAGMGQMSYDWYSRALLAGKRFEMDEEVLIELQKLNDLSQSNVAQGQPSLSPSKNAPKSVPKPNSENAYDDSRNDGLESLPYKKDLQSQMMAEFSDKVSHYQNSYSYKEGGGKDYYYQQQHVVYSDSWNNHQESSMISAIEVNPQPLSPGSPEYPSNKYTIDVSSKNTSGGYYQIARPRSAMPRLFHERNNEYIYADDSIGRYNESNGDLLTTTKPFTNGYYDSTRGSLEQQIEYEASRPKSALSKLGGGYSSPLHGYSDARKETMKTMPFPAQTSNQYPVNNPYQQSNLISNSKPMERSLHASPSFTPAHSVILLPIQKNKGSGLLSSTTSNEYNKTIDVSVPKEPANKRIPLPKKNKQQDIKKSESDGNLRSRVAAARNANHNRTEAGMEGEGGGGAGATKRSSLTKTKSAPQISKVNKTLISKAISVNQKPNRLSENPLLYLDEFAKSNLKRVAQVYIPYFKGLQVEARYQQGLLGDKTGWYPGRITQADFLSATYEIEFENGDRQKGIFVDDIRIPEVASKAALSLVAQPPVQAVINTSDRNKANKSPSDGRVPARVLRKKNGDITYSEVLRIMAGVSERSDMRKIERLEFKSFLVTRFQALVRGYFVRRRLRVMKEQLVKERELRARARERKRKELEARNGDSATANAATAHAAHAALPVSAGSPAKPPQTSIAIQTERLPENDKKLMTQKGKSKEKPIHKMPSPSPVHHHNTGRYDYVNANAMAAATAAAAGSSDALSYTHAFPSAPFSPSPGAGMNNFTFPREMPTPIIHVNNVDSEKNTLLLSDIQSALMSVKNEQKALVEIEERRLRSISQEFAHLREAIDSQRIEILQLKAGEEDRRRDLDSRMEYIVQRSSNPTPFSVPLSPGSPESPVRYRRINNDSVEDRKSNSLLEPSGASDSFRNMRIEDFWNSVSFSEFPSPYRPTKGNSYASLEKYESNPNIDSFESAIFEDASASHFAESRMFLQLSQFEEPGTVLSSNRQLLDVGETSFNSTNLLRSDSSRADASQQQHQQVDSFDDILLTNYIEADMDARGYGIAMNAESDADRDRDRGRDRDRQALPKQKLATTQRQQAQETIRALKAGIAYNLVDGVLHEALRKTRERGGAFSSEPQKRVIQAQNFEVPNLSEIEFESPNKLGLNSLFASLSIRDPYAIAISVRDGYLPQISCGDPDQVLGCRGAYEGLSQNRFVALLPANIDIHSNIVFRVNVIREGNQTMNASGSGISFGSEEFIRLLSSGAWESFESAAVAATTAAAATAAATAVDSSAGSSPARVPFRVRVSQIRIELVLKFVFLLMETYLHWSLQSLLIQAKLAELIAAAIHRVREKTQTGQQTAMFPEDKSDEWNWMQDLERLLTISRRLYLDFLHTRSQLEDDIRVEIHNWDLNKDRLQHPDDIDDAAHSHSHSHSHSHALALGSSAESLLSSGLQLIAMDIQKQVGKVTIDASKSFDLAAALESKWSQWDSEVISQLQRFVRALDVQDAVALESPRVADNLSSYCKMTVNQGLRHLQSLNWPDFFTLRDSCLVEIGDKAFHHIILTAEGLMYSTPADQQQQQQLSLTMNEATAENTRKSEGEMVDPTRVINLIISYV